MTLKRSPFPQRTKPMSRGKSPKAAAGLLRVAAVQREAKTKPMKSGKKPATVEERRWMASVAAFGCIVCHLQGRGYVPCAVHHIVEGGRRVGHMFTIGLCDPGHHQNTPDREQISRHPNKAKFVQAYGTEYELREKFIAISKAPTDSQSVDASIKYL
jgi:hypothetical protein